MIKKLQIKFIIIVMGVLLFVFAAMFLSLNIFMRNSSAKETDRLLEFIVSQDGIPVSERSPNGVRGPNPNPQRMRGGRFFYVKVNKENEILSLHMDMMFDITRDEAMEYFRTVFSQNKEKGTVYGLRYLIAEKDYGKIVAFAETNTEQGMLTQLINASLWGAGCSVLILLALSIVLSRWITKPVQAAFERQRQFISDASHELSTPLTILSANADVLENEIGVNTRLSQIKAQSGRMKELIYNLLALARTDESGFRLQCGEFDLSKAVLSATLGFESRAFEEKKAFSYDVQSGIRFIGDESRLKQVVAILVDNAIKHSESGGEIKVSLKTENGKTQFSVYNTGLGVAESEKVKIFERFYRSDASRSRETGGYGLGLAIAKSIIDAHKGKITVDGVYGKWVRFSVLL